MGGAPESLRPRELMLERRDGFLSATLDWDIALLEGAPSYWR